MRREQTKVIIKIVPNGCTYITTLYFYHIYLTSIECGEIVKVLIFQTASE